MLGRSAGWDLLPEHVVTAVTEAHLVGSIDQYSSKPYLAGQQVVTLSLQNQQYRGHYLSLIDASNTQVGVMLVLQNAHDTLNDHRFAIVLITIFCILLGGGLYTSAYTILGRTEHALETTRQKLLDEIDNTHNANTQLGLEIGEKRAAEQALKKAHAELEKRVVERTAQLDQQKRLMENLISNIPSYVAWKNLAGEYIGCNIGYAQLAGSSEEAIAGKVDAELGWSAEFRLTLAAVEKEVLVEKRAVLGREVIDETSEKRRVFICNAVPLKKEDGQLLGMVSILQNITEQKDRQKLLEETLTESRQANDRITGVMQSVDDALIVVDAADNILLMNESACTLLRLNPAEVLGKKVSSAIWLGSMRDKVVEVLRKREGGAQFDFEIGDESSPSSLVMQARSSVLIDPQGRYEGMIFLARDVTIDRSMERLKSDFISVAAHELRTPLATILGFSELLLDDNLGSAADRKEYVQTIYEKTDSLSRLLDDMLDIGRIESGRGLELFIEKVEVAVLFTPILKQYQKRVVDRKFTIDLDDPELLILADPEKIAQVMENLLSNAVKYSEPGSEVSVVGKATIRGYMMSISDEGIGMTPEQVKHSFDKFYRGDNADKAVKGTGLGLTIVKHIIEEHQGTIQLESRPSKGTRVHFLLPIA
jgi:PAS domain S-box-containing protein